MTPKQLYAVRQAYSDSFGEGMEVCAAVSAVCVVATFVTFRRNPEDIDVRMKKQREENIKRIKAMVTEKAAKAAASANASS